ncbi:MAG TPA: enoyl-ACP reductase [Candidatus Thermoplasmatota archaeon]|nr:enoyl-ACP reductase [Candidatus Thermoplasmatota archaeon]
MQDLANKRYIVFGVAADSSIAWAIARDLADRGALVTLAYQKRFLSRVKELVKDQKFVEQWEECDVANDASVATFFSKLTGQYDGVVHAVAFAPAEALGRPIVETSEEDFSKALVVSSYSLLRVARHALPKLAPDASFVTLTYLGAERVVPGYRVMGTAKAALESIVRELAASIGPLGHRVNAISAGPIKTLAASGVPGFDMILDWMAANTPLRRNVTQADVARTTSFLLSNEAAGITGQVIYVDAGYSAVGAPPDLQRVLVEPATSPPEGPQ